MIEKERKQLDITAPNMVQVEWDGRRKVLYVHIDGMTTLRVCRVDNIEFAGDLKESR